ncbi:kinase D-interacting substrate of 220 kDa B-like [Mytilus trossulus]|uniref:kinase D-interacting substrate of 220 kDa B-like n=1 Tax=Mytilus trossulus TaxID=6551 RepID=UPI003003BC02
MFPISLLFLKSYQRLLVDYYSSRMPLSKHLTSKEENNYLKLMHLLYKVSQSAIEKTVDQALYPDTLKTAISKCKIWNKLLSLKRNGKISATQWASLNLPSGLELQSSNLDMTLLIFLLNNITNIKVDSMTSLANYNIDFSKGTAVSTIKFYRNKLVHIDNYSSISDQTFNEIFEALTKAIIKLNPALGIDCESIKHATLSFDKHVGILTALHAMCHDGNYESAKALIRQGLPINGVDYLGLTPLHVASHEGHTNIVELLLNHGAKAVVNNGTFSGSRPLHFASHENHIDIVKILLDNGAHVNDSNKNGSTPLHLASYNNLTEIAEFLIKNGADINRGKSDKRTPLHVGCRAGNQEIVSLLCRYKALVDQPDKHGQVPLFYAEENGYREIILILRSINQSGSNDQNVSYIWLFLSFVVIMFGVRIYLNNI